MAVVIPGACYVEMATGHLVPLEKPEEFARLVLDFLADDLG